MYINQLVNELSSKYVQESLKRIIKAGGSYADIMILLENVILGTLKTNEQVFKVSPAIATELVEACLQNAIERYVGQKGNEKIH